MLGLIICCQKEFVHYVSVTKVFVNFDLYLLLIYCCRAVCIFTFVIAYSNMFTTIFGSHYKQIRSSKNLPKMGLFDGKYICSLLEPGPENKPLPRGKPSVSTSPEYVKGPKSELTVISPYLRRPASLSF